MESQKGFSGCKTKTILHHFVKIKSNENASILSLFPFRSAASKQIIQRITDHTYETTMPYSTNFTAPISNLTV